MAKGRSSGGNAHGTPSSLTSLLAPTSPQQAIAQQVVTVQQMWAENQAFFDPDRPIGYRPYNPDWDGVRTGKPGYRKNARVDGDRRRYKPGSHYQPAHALFDGARRLMQGNLTPRFKLPNYVSVCLRRKIRREVFLAKHKGQGSSRKRNRNAWSGIKC